MLAISSTPQTLDRVLLVGDATGLPELLARVPRERIVGFIAAAIRPQYHASLAELAQHAGIPLMIQPRVDSPDYQGFVDGLRALRPDGLLCHSYSMRLPPGVLALVPGRAFNVHFALLPRHRGPNPVQWALMHGDRETGVTLHVMDEAFDRGAIVDQQRVPITPEDTWVSLLERCRMAGRVLLDRAVPALMAGQWSATPQDEARAVSNRRIPPDSVALDFETMQDQQIVDLIRAQVAPLQGAYLDTPAGRVRFPQAQTHADVARLRAQHGRAAQRHSLAAHR